MTLLTRYSEVFFNDGLTLSEAQTRYAGRRVSVGKACGCPYLVTGIPNSLGHPYPWATVHAPFFQDPLFQFLTGVNQDNCAVFVDIARQKMVLFLPVKSAVKEFWDGTRLGCGSVASDSEAKQVTGLDVRDMATLSEFIVDYCLEYTLPELALFWYESKADQPAVYDHHAQFRDKMRQKLDGKGWTGQVVNLAPFQWPIRLCLDSVDHGLFREANRLTLEAISATIARLPSLKTEQEVCGVLQGELLRRSSKGLSFYPIVASGENACVLHYHKNDAVLSPDSLLLLDCGLRFHSMPADVTRTVAVSGAFNPLQALLHGIVETTQRVVEDSIKEGVTIASLNDLCWATMARLLEERFLSKGGRMERPYELTPHNVSHLIGLAVHDGDPYRNYRDMPLKAGMVISNEPGLYGRFSMDIDGVFYEEHSGIRIEDDIAVTALGSENLTRRSVV